MTWIPLLFQNEQWKPLCRDCNVPSTVGTFFLLLQSFSNLIRKISSIFLKLLSSLSQCWIFLSPEDVPKCRLCFTADKLTGLPRFLSPLQQDELPGLGSTHSGQYHVEDRPFTYLCPPPLSATGVSSMSSSFTCQNWMRKPFLPTKKGCNKLLLTFVLNFCTSCPLESTVILNWEFYTQKPKAYFLVSCVVMQMFTLLTIQGHLFQQGGRFVPNQP